MICLCTILLNQPPLELIILWAFVGLVAIQTAAWMVLFGLIVELILRTHYLAQEETQYEIIALKHLSTHPDINLAGPIIGKKEGSETDKSVFLPNNEMLN